MPSHGRGAYRAARAATKVLNEEKVQMDRDIAAWQDENARLRTELASTEQVLANMARATGRLEVSLRATKVCADRDWNRAKLAEARLAAVIALCDRMLKYHDFEGKNDLRAIRAAATGDTK